METVDVLVVGAGPTGLALTVQARAHGATVRIVDRNLDRARESRALAIQPRTLEVLTRAGIAAAIVGRGNPAVRVTLHAGRRTVSLPLFDLGMEDTDYPFLLFVSQAVTEQVLADQVEAVGGVAVERGVTLVDFHEQGHGVRCTLRHRDGVIEQVWARYLAGCDGAHSTVREQAGIEFAGGSYPQTFALADLEVDGLATGSAHAFLGTHGPLLFFPLGEPATWRVIAMRPAAGWPGSGPTEATTVAGLQSFVDSISGQRLGLRDPVWLTDFRLHRRHARRYRAGRIFLAGDAAHVHSPVGAQGMNTGIQDAWNLGWKLALVARGVADPALLDTYHGERAPVGRAVVRFTDRAFRVATASGPVARGIRGWLVPRLAPLVRFATAPRAAVFRVMAQLNIDYRGSAAVEEGRPRLRRGLRRGLRHSPRAGDRLPSAPIVVDGEESTLHAALAEPGFHLVLCGPADRWPAEPVERIARRHRELVSVHWLGPGATAIGWGDPTGQALARLGLRDPVRGCAQVLVRPDGHVGYRAAGTDLTGLCRYLSRWLPAPEPPPSGQG